MTASATRGSWQSRLTRPAPGFRSRPRARPRGQRVVAPVVVADAVAQRAGSDAVTPNCSTQLCSSGGTAWLVSWPPSQSYSSVSTTARPARRAAERGGDAAEAAADDQDVGRAVRPVRSGSSRWPGRASATRMRRRERRAGDDRRTAASAAARRGRTSSSRVDDARQQLARRLAADLRARRAQAGEVERASARREARRARPRERSSAPRRRRARDSCGSIPSASAVSTKSTVAPRGARSPPSRAESSPDASVERCARRMPASPRAPSSATEAAQRSAPTRPAVGVEIGEAPVAERPRLADQLPRCRSRSRRRRRAPPSRRRGGRSRRTGSRSATSLLSSSRSISTTEQDAAVGEAQPVVLVEEAPRGRPRPARW